MSISDFLLRCDSYCEARRISRARLSTLIFNDGKKLTALAEGADIGTRRLARASADLARLEADAAGQETAP